MIGDRNLNIWHQLVTLSPPEWLCVKVGSCVSHFNVSSTVCGQGHKTVSINHNFFQRKESRCGSNRGPTAYQPSALPLDQTGWQRSLVTLDTFKKQRSFATLDTFKKQRSFATLDTFKKQRSFATLDTFKKQRSFDTSDTFKKQHLPVWPAPGAPLPTLLKAFRRADWLHPPAPWQQQWVSPVTVDLAREGQASSS